MLSRHYVSNVGWVLKIGVDCTGSDKFVEVPGCSFGSTFDHCCSPKLWAESSVGHGILSNIYVVPLCGMVVRLKQWLGTLLVATLLAVAGWRGSVDLSTMGFNSIRISKSSRVINAKKCTTAINVFHSCTCFFADLQLVLQLRYFFCSCANFLYDSYVQFCSFAIFFAVVHLVLQL